MKKRFSTVHGHQFSLSGGSLTWSTWCWKCCWAVIAFTYVKRRFSCIFRPAVFITFHFWNVFLSNFIFLCLRRNELYHEVEHMYELLLSNCEHLCASAVMRGDINAMLIHAKGMTEIFSELVDSDCGMTEDGRWLTGWPGLEWLCQADWIPKFVLWHAFNLKIGGHSKICDDAPTEYQKHSETISANNCKLQVGLLLIHWNKV